MKIGFYFETPTIYARLIALVARKPVHTAIMLPGGGVFQSEAPVGVELLDRPAVGRWEWLEVPTISAAPLDDILQAEAGCKYDWLGVVLGWTFGIRSKSRWWCSELTAYCLQQRGVTLDRSNPIWYTPGRLYRELKRKGYGVAI